MISMRNSLDLCRAAVFGTLFRTIEGKRRTYVCVILDNSISLSNLEQLKKICPTPEDARRKNSYNLHSILYKLCAVSSI